MAKFIIETTGEYRFNTPERRKAMAEFIAGIIRANDTRIHEGIPLQQTPGNDSSWILDANNDWYLHFDDKDDARFHIQHRYAVEEATESLSRWVAWRYGRGWKVIVE